LAQAFSLISEQSPSNRFSVAHNITVIAVAKLYFVNNNVESTTVDRR